MKRSRIKLLQVMFEVEIKKIAVRCPSTLQKSMSNHQRQPQASVTVTQRKMLDWHSDAREERPNTTA